VLSRKTNFGNLLQQRFEHRQINPAKLRNIQGVKAKMLEMLQPALYLLTSSFINPSNAKHKKNALMAAKMKTSETENCPGKLRGI